MCSRPRWRHPDSGPFSRHFLRLPSAVGTNASKVDVEKIFAEATLILNRVTMLLQPANLYPFYDDILHGVLCGEVVPSLANFLLLTFLVGLVLFPWCAILTHRYLIRWMHWKLDQDGVLYDGESGSADSEIDSGSE